MGAMLWWPAAPSPSNAIYILIAPSHCSSGVSICLMTCCTMYNNHGLHCTLLNMSCNCMTKCRSFLMFKCRQKIGRRVDIYHSCDGRARMCGDEFMAETSQTKIKLKSVRSKINSDKVISNIVNMNMIAKGHYWYRLGCFFLHAKCQNELEKILVDLFCVLIILWKFQRDRSTATPRPTNHVFTHIYAYSSPLQTTPLKNIFHNTVYSDVTHGGIIVLLVTFCV